ncbi:MAG: KilA-N domain-containing protein [Leptospirales bacterium]
MAKITVLDKDVVVYTQNDGDYICITDIAKYKNAERTDDLIRNWLRNRNTIEFLGIWEQLNNPDFKPVEFDGFKKQAGLNSFTLTPKQWIKKTGAIGLKSKAGRYGGTYAHKDIAFEFASWISVEFKLYLIKEFQRLKEGERKQLGWDIRRNLAKINYRIHTDAIKNNLVPSALSKIQISNIYASEADVLNMALFGKTARQWREEHPKDKGNIRDHADVSQLVCLSNLENLNAHFIHDGIKQSERLQKLNLIAIQQMKLLYADHAVKKMGGKK